LTILARPWAGFARLSFLAAACPGCVAVRANWLAWRGPGGWRPGGPEGQVKMEVG